jgi:hypothetical protein
MIMQCGYSSRARIWLLLLGCLGVAPALAAAQDLDDRVAERLRNRVETAGFSGEIEAGSAPIYAVATVSDFYVRRLYRPGWSTGGRIHPTAAQLIQELRGATAEGLDPADYPRGNREVAGKGAGAAWQRRPGGRQASRRS